MEELLNGYVVSPFCHRSQPRRLVEVCYSLPSAPRYDAFQNKLKAYLPLVDGLPPATEYGDINAALKVLRGEKKEESCDEMGDGTSAPDTDQDVSMGGEPKREQTSVVADPFKVLLRNATEEFGFASRDVYDAIINPRSAQDRHDGAVVGIDCSGLRKIVGEFTKDKSLPNSLSHLVVVYPSQPLRNEVIDDSWIISGDRPNAL